MKGNTMSLAEIQPTPTIDLLPYFLDNVFVHTHVEKTGGSSFVVGLRSILGKDHVYDIRGGFPRPYEMSPKELPEIWLFSGHFWFDTQERPIMRKKRYFLTIRDPIDRFISCYNYVAAAKSHPGHLKYGVLDLEGAYRYLRKNNPNAIFNRVSAMFGERASHTEPGQPGRVVRGRRPVTFEEASAKMEKHYALVIPMHRIEDAVHRIGSVLGVDVPAVERVNVGIKRATELSRETLQEMQERNSEDYKLIAYFESAFDQHMADLPRRLIR
jgi:hypothetical protein